MNFLSDGPSSALLLKPAHYVIGKSSEKELFISLFFEILCDIYIHYTVKIFSVETSAFVQSTYPPSGYQVYQQGWDR